LEAHRATPLLLVLALLLVFVQGENDLYELLGIDEGASESEIKKAYRTLSKTHHPDKGGSAAKFKELTAAYEVLSDGEKRALYDVGGLSAVESGSGKRDPWGRPIGVPKGPPVDVTVRVPLEDMYKGGNVRANVRRRVVCRGCKEDRSWSSWLGSGQKDKCAGCERTCPPELKTVQKRMGPMLVNQEVEVPSQEKCKEEVRELQATIERGADDGTKIVFERASEQKPGSIPGDVHITLQGEKHAVFSRDGTHLSMQLHISLKQALLGFSRTIRHLDGHLVEIRHDTISRPQQVLVLPAEGMPVHGVPSEFGELRVTLLVDMPAALTAEEREFVTNHFDS